MRLQHSSIAPLILITLFFGCRPPAVVSEQNAAKFNQVIVTANNGYQMTMSELFTSAHKSGLAVRGGVVDTAQLRVFLDSVVCDSLTGLVAEEVRLAEHFRPYSQYRRRHYEFLIGTFLEQEVYSKAVPDSQEIVDYYHSRPDLFTVREQGLFYHVLITVGGLRRFAADSLRYRSLTDEQMEQESADYAVMVRGLIDSKQSFLEAAEKHSADTASGNLGGFIGWVARETYQHPFDSIAFEMRQGDVSDPFKDSQGWHILYCDQYIEQGVPEMTQSTYLSAKKSLQNEQTNEIGRKLTDSLFQEINLEYNEALLDTNLFLVDIPEWVAVVNGTDTIHCSEGRTIELSVRKQRQIENTDAAMKKEMYRQLARRFIVIQAARAAGVDTLPDAVANERALYRKYAKAILNRQRYPREFKPTDRQVERYYKSHPEEFKVKKPLTVQHIVTQDSVFGEYLRDQALSGVDFLELAREYYPGEKNVREELADLGEIGPNDIPGEFWKAALEVAIGDVSHPIKTEYGYHIIKVLARRETLDLTRARSKIVPLLREQHIAEIYGKYRDELFARFEVQFPGELYPIHLKPFNLRIQ